MKFVYFFWLIVKDRSVVWYLNKGCEEDCDIYMFLFVMSKVYEFIIVLIWVEVVFMEGFL